MSIARNRTIDYEPLNQKFTDQACSVDSIDLPDLKRSRVVEVYLTKAKAPQYYHTQERKEVVKFSVLFIPKDTPEGRSLLPHVKELVEAVLKDDYEPKVATINLLKKDGENIDETRLINDCVITGCEISMDKGDYLRIKFSLEGLLGRDN